MMNRHFFLIAMVCAFTFVSARAAELTLKTTDKEPPASLSADLRALLVPKVVQLLDGDKPVFEFWMVKELPVSAKPASLAKALDGLKSATLLGAVSVSGDRRDYRDDELHTGVYSMRFVLQPQDGNHLGTAEFNYFAALVPAKLDPKPDGIIDYKSLVKASSKETATDHPLILSLRPASSEAGESPKLNAPAPEHKSIRVKIPAKAGDEKTSVTFEIVYEGKGHK
jgi:hypothetical protein